MKRRYALTIFILILLLGELSERDLKTEEKPEEDILYTRDKYLSQVVLDIDEKIKEILI